MSDGWGGRRSGTGPKPTATELAPPEVAIAHELALPPGDLPDDQHAFWLKNAVLAIEKGTLTRHTESAFRLLCEMEFERRETLATLQKDGRTYMKVTVDGAGQEHQELKAHPLTGAYGRLAKAVETTLGRFGLAPFGKAEPGRAKAKISNPWGEVVGK